MIDRMHEMDISALVFDILAFCEAFLRMCMLNEHTDPEEGLTSALMSISCMQSIVNYS